MSAEGGRVNVGRDSNPNLQKCGAHAQEFLDDLRRPTQINPPAEPVTENCPSARIKKYSSNAAAEPDVEAIQIVFYIFKHGTCLKLTSERRGTSSKSNTIEKLFVREPRLGNLESVCHQNFSVSANLRQILALGHLNHLLRQSTDVAGFGEFGI